METMREIVIWGVLAWNSYTDIRARKIGLWSVVLLGSFGFILGGISVEAALKIAWGLLPGICMLGISLVTKGALGLGDGFLTMGLGMCLGAWETTMTLLTGLFGAAVWAGWDFMLGRKKKNAELPLVPFFLLGNLIRLLL